MTDQNLCNHCQSPLAPGAHFCSRCGFDVSGVQGGLATAKVAVAADAEDPQAGLLEELRRATLGDFDIAGELGRGGMATVFLAHEIALDRKVAIKVMSPALLQGGRGMADRFKREARTAAALSHPHIIPIFGVRESGRLLFFVMKFVQGRSLDAITKEHGPLPIKMVQAILAQSGSALDYAHRHGVIHRDIKPANIMLDVEGWAVLTDFGIAKVTEAQGLTMTGATIGTPTYMSPEQCAAKDITGATDQYSLGITAYEMITGKVPFDADSMMSLMWQHFHEPPPPILERRPDCPPELAQAIERMLAKKPADRWPTLEDAVEAIGNPPLNDPIRQQMKALARGGTLADAAQRHTPVSPVPTHAGPPTAGPATPRPSASPPPVATAASTTPIPVTPTAAAPPPPPPLPMTPVMPIAPPVTREVTESPTAVFVTPVPAPPRAPPAPAPPPAPPAPPRRSEPRRASRAEPAPVIPPPFAPVRRGGPLRVVGPAAVLIAAGVVAWVLFGRGRSTSPEPGPVVPATIEPVASVAVTPSPASIIVGGTTQLTAILKDSRNNLLTGREVVWASSDTTMARVSPSGVVQGLQPGYINVTATSGERTGTGTVLVTATVTPVAAVEVTPNRSAVSLGDSLVLSAVPKDTRGNTLSGRSVRWTSSDPSVATVSPGGVVLPRREGTAAISAAIEGKSATARITVTQPVVAAVAVTPSTVSLQVGGRAQLTVAARDARGNALRDRPVTWTTSDRTLAAVSPDGAVTALSPGLVTITARIETENAVAAVTIAAIPVATVSVTPATLTLAAGKTAQLAASLRDARNTIMTDRQVRWSSSDAAVATVSPGGIVTGVAGGTATITATSEVVTGSAAVTVTSTALPVASVNVTPATLTVATGKTAQLSASVHDARGGVLEDRELRWSSSAPGVATVSPSGTVTAVSGGTATIAAMSEGTTGSATITVPAAPRESVMVAERTLALRGGLAAGGSHSCGITQSGAAVCWGNNAAGQLGDASVGATSAMPTLVAHPAGFTSLVAGNDYACGLTQSGSAVCWGLNTKGQLGAGRTSGAPTPVAVAGGRSYSKLAAGARHACGLVSDGSVWCWGDNNAGQLGDGTTRGANAPRRVRGDTRFKALAAGSDHTCGLSQNGQAFCWGDGFSGQLGRGARETQSEPVAVDVAVRFSALAAGGKHACALAQNGKVYCWGANVAGEIGDGSKDGRDRPVTVSGTRTYEAIAAGPEHNCALTEDGAAFCWGRNRSGQLGDGSVTDRLAPVRVASEQPFSAISAGGSHSCGVTPSGVACWGGNTHGQLGDGTVTARSTPAAVEAGAGRP
jgi:serine/threonine protein kinase/uncharacterized protein YjdB/alpha-tubulin suppressor-like RCC1 family protein